ncbi:MAG: diguanylate cyclase domain-containing protein [Betaproteobacteria bacterium]
MIQNQNPKRGFQDSWRGYVAAVCLVGIAGALRIYPLDSLGSTLPFLTFYPAATIAAIYGGLSAGLLAGALACFTVVFFWPLIVAQPFIVDSADWLRMLAFVLVCAVTSGVVELVRRAQIRGERARAHAEAAAEASRMSAWVSAESERFIKAVADAMPGMVGYWDNNLCCRFANRHYLEWFGKAPEEIVGHSIQELLGDRLFALNKPYILGALSGVRQQYERTLTKADGSIGHTWAHYIPDIDAQGAVAGFFVLVSDITPLKAAEAERRLSASVYQNTIEGIVVTDEHGVILSVNPAFTKITGYPAEEAIGQTPGILKSGRHDQAFYKNLWGQIAGAGRWQGEIWNRRKDGEIFVEWQTITRIPETDGEPVRYVAMFHDITELWQKNESLRHLAFHDMLTDLPNRSLLIERIERQVAMGERDNRGLAVLFLDLDHFKSVNDHLGHDIGDDLLRAVAKKLQALVRITDTVARLGGDEFVIVLDNPASAEEVAQVAKRVIAVINEPMELCGQPTQVGASVGIALYPSDGKTPAELIKSADVAMYAAKYAGKNTYRFFAPEMLASVDRPEVREA